MTGRFQRTLGSLTVILASVAGCGRLAAPATTSNQLTTLTVGFGLPTGADPQFGIQQLERNLALEFLLDEEARDGRPRPWLAESWSQTPDGLTWRFRLRPSLTFHTGKPVTAEIVSAILAKDLPKNLGPAFDDVDKIRAVSDREIEFSLRRRSAFVLEGLDVPIAEPGSPLIGTGPFYVADDKSDRVEMRANDRYHLGKPHIDRVVIKAYASLRAAWADMLRGQVDMLYDVGMDALGSLQRSNAVKIFAFQRAYAYTVILNVRKPYLRDAGLRRTMNAAIDRQELVSQALNGHGTPALGPVWPYHWAFDPSSPGFRYQPVPVVRSGLRPLTCLIFDPSSSERLALALQKQLQVIGIDLKLEVVSADKILERLETGDFELILIDAAVGPGLVFPYLFWHSGGPYNWGGFSSQRVDLALDAIRHSADDEEYKAGVAAFQRAVVEDPPAIFLAWSERARAVSRRFEVPIGSERDVLKTIRLWRPTIDQNQPPLN